MSKKNISDLEVQNNIGKRESTLPGARVTQQVKDIIDADMAKLGITSFSEYTLKCIAKHLEEDSPVSDAELAIVGQTELLNNMAFMMQSMKSELEKVRKEGYIGMSVSASLYNKLVPMLGGEVIEDFTELLNNTPFKNSSSF
jgi:uncharacterized protein involved in response to NO